MTYEAGLHRLPEHMHASIRQWIDDGIRPGPFLTAVLQNDLATACLKADDINRDYLREYVMFLYNDAPCACFGTAGEIELWSAAGGLNGLSAQRSEAA